MSYKPDAFVPGDVVELRLAPGGSTMTIESITEDTGGPKALCVWHNQAGGPFRQSFNVNRLRLVRRGDRRASAPPPERPRIDDDPVPFSTASYSAPEPAPLPEPTHHHHDHHAAADYSPTPMPDYSPSSDYSSPAPDSSPSYDGGGGGGDFGGGGSSGEF